jgi:hypothetical protein
MPSSIIKKPAQSGFGGQTPDDFVIERSAIESWTSFEALLSSAAGVCEPLGELLVQAKRITPKQRDFCLAEQKQTGEKLGDMLVRFGWLSRAEVDAVLALQGQQNGRDGSLRLGKILMTMGVVTQEQLDAAIALQQTSHKRLGDVLVEAGYAKPSEVVRGLSLQRRLRKAAVTTLLSFVAISIAPAVYADSRAKGMTVSTTVIAHAKLNVLSQTPQLTITAANIERGYVDVPAASDIEVRSNSREGFALVFDTMPNLFESVQITGLGAPVELGMEGGTVVQRRYTQQPVSIRLGYRFILFKEVQPGNYAWPIALSARSL